MKKKPAAKISLGLCHHRHWDRLQEMNGRFERSALIRPEGERDDRSLYQSHPGLYASVGRYMEYLVPLGCIKRIKPGVYDKVMGNDEIEAQVQAEILRTGTSTVEEAAERQRRRDRRTLPKRKAQDEGKVEVMIRTSPRPSPEPGAAAPVPAAEPTPTEPTPTETMVDMGVLAEHLVRQFAVQNHSLRSRIEELEQDKAQVLADFRAECDKFIQLDELYRRAQEKINALNQEKAQRAERDFVPLSKIQSLYKQVEENSK